MINEINATQSYGTTAAVKSVNQTAASKTDTASQTDQSAKADTIEIGSRTETSVVYSKVTSNKLSETDIAKLQAQADATTENLRRLVQELILKQSKSDQTSSEDSSAADVLSGLGITTKDVETAKQAISEDGDFGVKAVSDRLVNFAIAVSGGDKSKLSELISAIDEGFDEAKKALGGKLPDISQQTYDETMKKLKEWASSSDSNGSSDSSGLNGSSGSSVLSGSDE